jgi:hypothetical protein
MVGNSKRHITCPLAVCLALSLAGAPRGAKFFTAGGIILAVLLYNNIMSDPKAGMGLVSHTGWRPVVAGTGLTA